MGGIENPGLSLLEAARGRILVPEMQVAFDYALKHPEAWQQQLVELDGVISWINEIPVDDVPEDMANTRQTKQLTKAKGIAMPSPLNPDVHINQEYRVIYGRMLREANELFGPHFTFHTKEQSLEHRLAAALMDGYSMFLTRLLKQDSPTFDNVITNMICEVIAHIYVQQTDGSFVLFDTAKELGWYNPEYGFDATFLSAHSLGG